MSTEPVTYDYTFSIWPEENWGWEKPLFDVFRLIAGRVTLPFSATAFADFRRSMGRQGFTLRAITRVPHHEQEVVL